MTTRKNPPSGLRRAEAVTDHDSSGDIQTAAHQRQLDKAFTALAAEFALAGHHHRRMASYELINEHTTVDNKVTAE